MRLLHSADGSGLHKSHAPDNWTPGGNFIAGWTLGSAGTEGQANACITPDIGNFVDKGLYFLVSILSVVCIVFVFVLGLS